MRRKTKMTIVALLLALIASGASAQSEPKYEELPKFQRVNAILYRGAQPKSGGLRRLASLGIRTIINL